MTFNKLHNNHFICINNELKKNYYAEDLTHILLIKIHEKYLKNLS